MADEAISVTDGETDREIERYTDIQTIVRDRFHPIIIIPTGIKHGKCFLTVFLTILQGTVAVDANLLLTFVTHRKYSVNHSNRTTGKRKNATPPDIIRAILVTKFHEDQTKNLSLRVLTMKNAPQPDIIGTNLLKNFHDDRNMNVASRVKNASPPLKFHPNYVFQATGIIFKLVQDIIGKNLLLTFHDDRKINVASRVLTRKNTPPPWRPCFPYIAMPRPWLPCFQATGIIFKLVQDIIRTNLLTKIHDDRTINMASRV
ncbi:hypothetical protein DPMN_036056 [Dreissena polymorpha]|uniref:Uncharacterized protein n=1 Tax=Dreissena polymorpha TaxID=45954 RepID=A0A9D4RMP1_DREPO|nr:hypothetical protein DPMN_036056 [Dreissena polymorpha]